MNSTAKTAGQRLLRLLTTTAIAMTVTSCSSSSHQRVTVAGAHPSHWDRTGKVLISEKTNTVYVAVATRHYYRDTDIGPGFALAVHNGTQHVLGISSANVRAFSGDAPVRVYSEADVANLVDARRAEVSIAEAFAALNVIFGPAPRTYVNEFADTADRSAFRAKDPAERARETNFARVNGLNTIGALDSGNSAQSVAARGLLHSSDVPPGEAVWGEVFLHTEDIAPGKPLKIVVTIDSEQHDFYFSALPI